MLLEVYCSLYDRLILEIVELPQMDCEPVVICPFCVLLCNHYVLSQQSIGLGQPETCLYT